MRRRPGRMPTNCRGNDANLYRYPATPVFWRDRGVAVGGNYGGAPLEGIAGCRGGGRVIYIIVRVSGSCRRGRERTRRRCRDRSYRRGRTDDDRRRPHPGLDRAGTDGIVRRIEVRAREAGTNWAVFALANSSDEQLDRLIVVPHYQMVGSRSYGPTSAQSRIVNVTAERRRPPGSPGQRNCRHLPHHPRPRHGPSPTSRELRTSKLPQIYLWEPDCLQGQGQQLHPLSWHRHRHCRPAGAVPHHPLRRQGKLHVSGGSRAGLGRAGLHRGRLRLLGQSVRTCRRAPSGSGVHPAKRSWRRRCSCSCSPTSTSTAGMCAIRTLRSAGLPFLGALVAVAVVRSVDCVRHCAAVAAVRRGRRLRASSIYLASQGFDRAVLLDPDLVPPGGLGIRGGLCHRRLGDQ